MLSSSYSKNRRAYLKRNPGAKARGPQLAGHAQLVHRDRIAAEMVRAGRRLRDLRLEAGIAIAELSAASGVGFNAIVLLELGARRDAKLSTVIALARALGVSPCEVFA